jgi:hypothetical protein
MISRHILACTHFLRRCSISPVDGFLAPSTVTESAGTYQTNVRYFVVLGASVVYNCTPRMTHH